MCDHFTCKQPLSTAASTFCPGFMPTGRPKASFPSGPESKRIMSNPTRHLSGAVPPPSAGCAVFPFALWPSPDAPETVGGSWKHAEATAADTAADTPAWGLPMSAVRRSRVCRARLKERDWCWPLPVSDEAEDGLG